MSGKPKKRGRDTTTGIEQERKIEYYIQDLGKKTRNVMKLEHYIATKGGNKGYKVNHNDFIHRHFINRIAKNEIILGEGLSLENSNSNSNNDDLIYDIVKKEFKKLSIDNLVSGIKCMTAKLKGYNGNIRKYIESVLKQPQYLGTVFIIDTMHDIHRIRYIQKAYSSILGNNSVNFYKDYEEYLNIEYNPNGDQTLTELLKLIFEITKISSFENQIYSAFTQIIGEIYEGKNEGTNKYIRDNTYMEESFNNRKNVKPFVSFDVWKNRDSFPKKRNLYTAYYDSNPTNAGKTYLTDQQYVDDCPILKFTITGKPITYTYDTDTEILTIDFSNTTYLGRSTMYTKNYVPIKVDSGSNEFKKILDSKTVQDMKLSPELNKKMEYIMGENYYDFKENKFTYTEKNTGPSINTLCAVGFMYMLNNLDNIRNAYKSKNKSVKYSHFRIFEELFTIKRIGDLGQIVLCKKFGDYTLATEDKMQVVLSILFGSSVITTCSQNEFVYYFKTNTPLIKLGDKCERIVQPKRDKKG